MARQTTLVKINPAVVKWIIDDSGFDAEELAEKITVAKSDIERWCTSRAEIEIRNLKKLSKAVKRPITVFFLPDLPEEPGIADYRRPPGRIPIKLTPDTRRQIRDARHLQEIAGELMKSQGIEMAPKIAQITTRSSPEKIAKAEREKLGFESNEPSMPGGAQTPEGLYAALRRSVESLNMFVMQASMPVNEVRGITLSGRLPVVIVISSKDQPAARTFSLLHEYGHVLLRKDGMCIPQTAYEDPYEIRRVEGWCNRFAASVLMPEALFLKTLHNLKDSGIETEEIISKLASKFKASKLAVAIRMRDLGQDGTDAPEHARLLENLRGTLDKKPSGRTGGPGTARLCVSRKGRKFVSLVLASESRNIINISDVADYLEIKIKHLKRPEKETL